MQQLQQSMPASSQPHSAHVLSYLELANGPGETSVPAEQSRAVERHSRDSSGAQSLVDHVQHGTGLLEGFGAGKLLRNS